MKIRRHFCYDDYNLKVRGNNVSSIIDKLIRLTAKITEWYGSDIIYDIETYRECVKAKQSYDFILCFREMGVNSFCAESVMEPDFEYSRVSESIQSWRLQYDPEENLSTLYRVNLIKED